MLKRTIDYEDFNGDKVSEVFYFNLTKSELIELDVGYEGGIGKVFERIVEAKDQESVIREFKKFILASYGIKSDDGKRFVKNEQLRDEFTQTAAYDALFMELAVDADKGSEFIIGVLPRDFQENAQKEMKAANQGELFAQAPEHHGRVTGPSQPKE